MFVDATAQALLNEADSADGGTRGSTMKACAAGNAAPMANSTKCDGCLISITGCSCCPRQTQVPFR